MSTSARLRNPRLEDGFLLQLDPIVIYITKP